MQDLPDVIPSWARHATSVAGTRKGIRREVDFAAGSSKVTIAGVDSATGDKVTVTIDVSAADLATALAGNGLDASAGTLVVDETELDHGTLGGLSDDDHPQYVAHSLADAKGDLLVGSADNDWNRKAAGSDYYVPQWLASATDGLQAGPTTQTWTPTLAQGASTNISKTVNFANYWRVGPLVFFHARCTASAAGTAGSAITLTLPVTGSLSTIERVGEGYYFDASVALYQGLVYVASTTTVAITRGDQSSANNPVGVDPNIAVASSDIIEVHGWYLAA